MIVGLTDGEDATDTPDANGIRDHETVFLDPKYTSGKASVYASVKAAGRTGTFIDAGGLRRNSRRPVIETAWRYMRGEIDFHDEHEGVLIWFTAVIRMHDPAAISVPRRARAR